MTSSQTRTRFPALCAGNISFWLVHWIISALYDWPEWSFWSSYDDTHWKPLFLDKAPITLFSDIFRCNTPWRSLKLLLSQSTKPWQLIRRILSASFIALRSYFQWINTRYRPATVFLNSLSFKLKIFKKWFCKLIETALESYFILEDVSR